MSTATDRTGVTKPGLWKRKDKNVIFFKTVCLVLAVCGEDDYSPYSL